MADVDESLIEQVYVRVLELHREAYLGHAIALGRLVVEKLLGGDVQRWRQGGNTDVSVRRLAERVSAARPVRLSAATLYRSIGVYEMDTRLHLRDLPGVCLAHAVAVLPLPPHEQAAWLHKVAPNQWSASDLRRQLGQKRDPTGLHLDRVAKQLAKKLDEAVTALAAAAPAERAAARKRIAEIGRAAADALAALEDPAPAEPATPVPDPPVPNPPVVDRPVVEPPAPSPPAVVLTDSESAAGALRAPEVTVGVADWVLAGVPAPNVDDIREFFRARWDQVPPDSPWHVHTLSTPSPQLATLLDRAERAGHLQLRFGSGLRALLDLCVTAEIVSLRPSLPARTTVVLDAPVPFLDAAPRVRPIWRAFRSPTPLAWRDLLGRGLPARFEAAIRDWLCELPHPRTGLAASQAALLDGAAHGRTALQAIRGALGPLDETAIEHHLVGMCTSGALAGLDFPALNDTTVQRRDAERYLAVPLRLTPLGEALRAGRADYLRHAKEERWWGGMRVTIASSWRFDPESQGLLPPEI